MGVTSAEYEPIQKKRMPEVYSTTTHRLYSKINVIYNIIFGR